MKRFLIAAALAAALFSPAVLAPAPAAASGTCTSMDAGGGTTYTTCRDDNRGFGVGSFGAGPSPSIDTGGTTTIRSVDMGGGVTHHTISDDNRSFGVGGGRTTWGSYP